MFLNNHNVNFRTWTDNNIEDIDEPSKKSKRSYSMDC